MAHAMTVTSTIVDVDLDHRAEIGFDRFLHCSIPLDSTFHAVCFGRSHGVQPTPRDWGGGLHLLENRVST